MLKKIIYLLIIKKKNFLKNFSNNYIKRINNLKVFSKKKSFFIIGNAFAFYKGSISPFYGSKFSWFIETGLKSDVECSNIEINPFYVEAQNLTKLKHLSRLVDDRLNRPPNFNQPYVGEAAFAHNFYIPPNC